MSDFMSSFGPSIVQLVFVFSPEPSCAKHRKLNELVSGQNANCSSKYNI